MDLKHICYSLISVSFLLPLVICAEDKAIRSIQSSAGQQEEPPGIYVGELTDSRHARRNRKYKCYQGQMSERSNQELSECIGAFCMRIRHHQSGEEKLYCKNFTEPDDPKPGTCKEAPGHQMHGQTETICACEGNFCNGTYALNPLPLILLLACLAALLICSSFVGSVIFTR